jgi:hypothetical protein
LQSNGRPRNNVGRAKLVCPRPPQGDLRTLALDFAAWLGPSSLRSDRRSWAEKELGWFSAQGSERSEDKPRGLGLARFAQAQAGRTTLYRVTQATASKQASLRVTNGPSGCLRLDPRKTVCRPAVMTQLFDSRQSQASGWAALLSRRVRLQRGGRTANCRLTRLVHKDQSAVRQ